MTTPLGRIAKRLLGWLVKKGLEEAEKELERRRDPRADETPAPRDDRRMP